MRERERERERERGDCSLSVQLACYSMFSVKKKKKKKVRTMTYHAPGFTSRCCVSFQFEQFVAEDLHDVFDFDGLVTSHPIYVPVYHPDEINEIFDRISYGKVGPFCCFFLCCSFVSSFCLFVCVWFFLSALKITSPHACFLSPFSSFRSFFLLFLSFSLLFVRLFVRSFVRFIGQFVCLFAFLSFCLSCVFLCLYFYVLYRSFDFVYLFLCLPFVSVCLSTCSFPSVSLSFGCSVSMSVFVSQSHASLSLPFFSRFLCSSISPFVIHPVFV